MFVGEQRRNGFRCNDTVRQPDLNLTGLAGVADRSGTLEDLAAGGEPVAGQALGAGGGQVGDDRIDPV